EASPAAAAPPAAPSLSSWRRVMAGLWSFESGCACPVRRFMSSLSCLAGTARRLSRPDTGAIELRSLPLELIEVVQPTLARPPLDLLHLRQQPFVEGHRDAARPPLGDHPAHHVVDLRRPLPHRQVSPRARPL